MRPLRGACGYWLELACCGGPDSAGAQYRLRSEGLDALAVIRQDRRVEAAKRRYCGPRDEQWAGRAVGLPLILIGYWKADPAGAVADEDVADEAGWPVAADFVDERWDEAERDRVAFYLGQGLVPWAQMGVSPCRLCGAANGSAERTDGAYLWPEGLAHYLRDHGVRPPVSVIRHIIGRQASMQRPPDEDQDWWKTLQDTEGGYDGVRTPGGGQPGSTMSGGRRQRQIHNGDLAG
jgi:hypothetical protein